MVKQHISGLEGPLNLIPVLGEATLELGIEVGSPGQPNHVLWPALVLGTVVHHAEHPVEEVVGRGVLSVRTLGGLYLGLGW